MIKFDQVWLRSKHLFSLYMYKNGKFYQFMAKDLRLIEFDYVRPIFWPTPNEILTIGMKQTGIHHKEYWNIFESIRLKSDNIRERYCKLNEKMLQHLTKFAKWEKIGLWIWPWSNDIRLEQTRHRLKHYGKSFNLVSPKHGNSMRARRTHENKK